MTKPEAISWDVAAKVADRVARQEPFSASYLSTSLEADFAELTPLADSMVQQHTGLVADGASSGVVTGRSPWVGVNLRSLRRLFEPVADRLAERRSGRGLSALGRITTGTQIGLVLGWMSSRVLGQYDVMLAEDAMDQDRIYYVGPNVLALEKRYAFPPRQFRLWLAVHECTHRAQFTGVPWLAPWFRQQVHGLLASVAEPERLGELLRSAVSTRKKARPSGQGLLSAFTTPEQDESIQRLSGLMALLEGHAEVTMKRAGVEAIPDAERFHRVLHERRASADGLTRLTQRLLGLDAKLRQYAEGAAFVESVVDVEGEQFFRQVWVAPENLPSAGEIRDPHAWITRMRSAGADAIA